MNNNRKRENQFRRDVGPEFIQKQNFRDVKKEEQELYEKQVFLEKSKKELICSQAKTRKELSSTLFQTFLLYGIIKNAYFFFS